MRKSLVLRALLVEDSREDAELIARALTGVATVRIVSSRAALQTAFEHPDTFDLVLADFCLPDLDGLTVLSLASERVPDKPLIIVSGTITEQVAIDALQNGAKDYVIKDRLQRLPVAVKRVWKDKEKDLLLRKGQRWEYQASLSASVAHDLNNVFHPIGAGISLLRMGLQPPEQEKILRTMEAANQRGAQLVKQMVRFAKGTNGHKRGVDLKELIQEVVLFLQSTIETRLKIETQIERDLPLFNGDAVQVHQVLMNLCVNARDAMPAAGDLLIDARTVELKDFVPFLAAAEPVSGDFVCLSVSDTGTGMSPEVMARIFEPFFTTKGDAGNGIGLPTVVNIVREHNGCVDVSSKPGFGSQFMVYFPYDRGQSRKPEPPGGAGRTILLVDDETSILEINQAFLESSDYKVLAASNGVGGLRLLEQHKAEVRVLLTDFVMPMMDGRELVRRAREVRPDLKVILMTGLTGTETIDGLAVDAILKKPFQPSDLLQELDRLA